MEPHRAVAAALGQARFPLLVMQRHQHGDQRVPLLGGQAGQRRMAEPGQVAAGPAEWIRDTRAQVVVLGMEV